MKLAPVDEKTFYELIFLPVLFYLAVQPGLHSRQLPAQALALVLQLLPLYLKLNFKVFAACLILFAQNL